MSSLREQVLAYLREHHAALYGFWVDGGPMPEAASVEAHCDVVYSLYMVGALEMRNPASSTAFAGKLAKIGLAGLAGGDEASRLSVHNTAYAFGALNLLRPHDGDLYAVAVAGRGPDFDRLFDPVTKIPRFPRKFTHHNWRVSHWLGGAPSLLLSLGQSAIPDAPVYLKAANDVLAAVNAGLNPANGLIRMYKSEALQQAFRFLYGVRHDPELGDVGGVAHILWVNHVVGRPYVAADKLLRQSTDLFVSHAPYMERVPYCLDFDVVQIVRTAIEQTNAPSEQAKARSETMISDLEGFFASRLSADYALHKVPGALATLHECALIVGRKEAPGLSVAPIDIIKGANWL